MDIDKLIQALQFVFESGISVSTDFDFEIGCAYLRLRLQKGDKAITKRFYFVPIGKDSWISLINYNPMFEEDIKEMVQKLCGSAEIDESGEADDSN